MQLSLTIIFYSHHLWCAIIMFISVMRACLVLVRCCRTVSGNKMRLTKSLTVNVLFKGSVLLVLSSWPQVVNLMLRRSPHISMSCVLNAASIKPWYWRSTRWIHNKIQQYKTELHFLFSKQTETMCEVVYHVLFSGAHEIFTAFRHHKEILSWNICSFDSLLNMSDH